MNRQVIYYHGHRYMRRAARYEENNRPHIAMLVSRKDPGTFMGTPVSERVIWHGAPMRLIPTDAGCYVDGHWGQYAVAHMVQRAEEMGYDNPEVTSLADRHMDECAHGSIARKPLDDDEHEALIDASDEVEEWLNEHIAPEGYHFGWHEGEFFLWSQSQWEE